MKALCMEYGFIGVFPSDADKESATDVHANKEDAGAAISKKNEELMRSCDFAIANLTPYRGPSCDVGTAYEVGFLTALSKPVFG
jgi:nucleoside 2-deoxyribosyltransferase